MNEVFGFSRYTDHEFFHIRYGKGAVIIAVKKNKDESTQEEFSYSDLHIAKIFNTRDQEINSVLPYLDPVHSIEENNGFIKVKLKFDRNHKNNPTYRPLKSTVERILPVALVTFETIK